MTNSKLNPQAATAAKYAIAAVIGVWGLNWVALALPNDTRGVMGDMFGISNTLFSGLALVGLVYAIIVQRQEMMIARDELKHTKKLLEEQQAQLKVQNEATEKQAFENTFFRLLTLFSDLTTNMDLERTKGTSDNAFRGKDVFPIFIGDLKRMSDEMETSTGKTTSFIDVYDRFYSKRNREVGHYFRLMYNIVKFVHRSNIREKRFYTNILRAQLSDFELELLMYNGASRFGVEKFKPLIEEYSLLNNLPDGKLALPNVTALYSTKAFAEDGAVTGLAPN